MSFSRGLWILRLNGMLGIILLAFFVAQSQPGFQNLWCCYVFVEVRLHSCRFMNGRFMKIYIYVSWSGWTEAVQMGVLMQWQTTFVPERCSARSKLSRATRRISMLAATWAAALQLAPQRLGAALQLAPQQQVSSLGQVSSPWTTCRDFLCFSMQRVWPLSGQWLLEDFWFQSFMVLFLVLVFCQRPWCFKVFHFTGILQTSSKKHGSGKGGSTFKSWCTGPQVPYKITRQKLYCCFLSQKYHCPFVHCTVGEPGSILRVFHDFLFRHDCSFQKWFLSRSVAVDFISAWWEP